jgi:hypothetical protein
LSGQRAQRLGQQLEAVDLDRQLTGARRHHGAVGTDPVAPVELFTVGEPVVADDRLGDEQLAARRPRSAIVANTELAGVTLEDDPPGDGDLVSGLGARVEVGPHRSDLGDRVGAVEAVRVRLATLGADRVDLALAPGALGRQPAPGVLLHLLLLVHPSVS